MSTNVIDETNDVAETFFQGSDLDTCVSYESSYANFGTDSMVPSGIIDLFSTDAFDIFYKYAHDVSKTTARVVSIWQIPDGITGFIAPRLPQVLAVKLKLLPGSYGRAASTCDCGAYRRSVEDRYNIPPIFDLLKKEPHPNILQIFDWEEVLEYSNKRIDIARACFERTVMEYCNGGNLGSFGARYSERSELNRINGKKAESVPEGFIWHVFYEVCKALEFLQSLEGRADSYRIWGPVLHRDVKPEHIMLNWAEQPGTTGYFPQVKLTDFSWAGEFDENVYPGTSAWRAPDCWPMTFASDVWSLGAVIYYLCNGCPPIEDYADSLEVYGVNMDCGERVRLQKWEIVNSLYSPDLSWWICHSLAYAAPQRIDIQTLRYGLEDSMRVPDVKKMMRESTLPIWAYQLI